MSLTIDSIKSAERALRANGVAPPYLLRATDATMRHLLRSAAATDGVQLVDSKRFRKDIKVEPGERVVARVGDTYLVVRT